MGGAFGACSCGGRSRHILCPCHWGCKGGSESMGSAHTLRYNRNCLLWEYSVHGGPTLHILALSVGVSDHLVAQLNGKQCISFFMHDISLHHPQIHLHHDPTHQLIYRRNDKLCSTRGLDQQPSMPSLRSYSTTPTIDSPWRTPTRWSSVGPSATRRMSSSSSVSVPRRTRL